MISSRMTATVQNQNQKIRLIDFDMSITHTYHTLRREFMSGGKLDPTTFRLFKNLNKK